MIKKLTILIILFAPFLAFGQAQITLGKPYAVIDAREKYYFRQGDDLLTVKIDGRTVIIQKFSTADLSFKKIRTYKDALEGYSLEKITKFQDKLYLFCSSWDKSNQREQLFCREIDFNEGSFRGELQKVLQVEGKISGSPLGAVGFWSFGVTDKFDFYFSYDSAKLLVQYRLRPEVKDDSKSFDVIGMGVYDKNMDLQWKEEIKMPYTEKKMNNLDYSIDQQGNGYILSTVYEDKTTDIKKSKDGNPNYHIELLRIKAGTKKFDITPVRLAEKFISKIWIYETPAEEMICAGFYNKKGISDNADGILLFKVSKEGGLRGMSTYEIPLEILNQNVSRRTQKRNEKKEEDEDGAEFRELELRDVFVQSDGSIILIGEQYFIREHTSYSNNRVRTYYTYHYNDMLITKVDPAGKLAWMKKLPKIQIGSAGQGGMSYSYLKSASDHYLLFLDNFKNRNLPANEVPERHADGQGGYLTAYKINNTSGDVKKEYILDTRNVEGIEIYQFMMTRIIPVSSQEFVFESYKKKKEDILIKVGF